MIFNILILVLILLITAYLANQGLLSALLIFISATFASILAGGLFESLQGIVAGYRPDYARGVTFLLLFFLGLSVCRLTTDFLVPKNIKLPKVIDVSAAAVVAVFASLVIVGSMLIGIQMLPLPTELLGYDRFPGEKHMQAYVDEDDKRIEKPGILAPSSSPWFAPDSFTVGIWNCTLGRSMGGDQPFAATHPDLLTEIYGYRNSVQFGDALTVHPDLVDVPAASWTDDASLLKRYQIPVESGKIAAVVRTIVTNGTDQPKVSSNGGNIGGTTGSYFFVTPSQVRLVTDKDRQYYPIGYLQGGRDFVPLSLDDGQFGDAFSKDKAIDDWVFELNDDEKPTLLEIKQLARKPLVDILKKGSITALAAGDYPPLPATSGVTFNVVGPDGAALKDTAIYVLKDATCARRDVDGPVKVAYDNILEHASGMENSTGEWASAAGKPGVPDRSVFNMAGRAGLDIKNKAPTDQVYWRDVIPLLLAGAAVPDGARNLTILPDYFKKTIVPIFSSTGSDIKNGTTDASGNATIDGLPRGEYTIVGTVRTDNAFYVWIDSVKIEAKPITKQLSTGQTAYSVVMPK